MEPRVPAATVHRCHWCPGWTDGSLTMDCRLGGHKVWHCHPHHTACTAPCAVRLACPTATHLFASRDGLPGSRHTTADTLRPRHDLCAAAALKQLSTPNHGDICSAPGIPAEQRPPRPAAACHSFSGGPAVQPWSAGGRPYHHSGAGRGRDSGGATAAAAAAAATRCACRMCACC